MPIRKTMEVIHVLEHTAALGILQQQKEDEDYVTYLRRTRRQLESPNNS
jgi:hypothetical protein